MVRPQARFVDGQRAAEERLGLRGSVRCAQQIGEIAEGRRQIGMLRPEARFVDRQRSAVEWLGLGEAVRGA